MQLLRKTPVEGSEKRYLSNYKKAFQPNKLRPQVVENMCDYVEARCLGVQDIFGTMAQETPSARALWYAYSQWVPQEERKKQAKKPEKPDDEFDPNAERSTIFPVDCRRISNIKIVAEALVMYLQESETERCPQDAHDLFVDSVSGNADDAAVKKALEIVLKAMTSDAISCTHRVVLMVLGIAKQNGQPQLQKELAQIFGRLVFRCPSATAEQDKNTAAVKGRALEILLSSPELLPAEYKSTSAREGQARHFVPQLMRENEWEILLEGATKTHFKGGEVVVAENVVQDCMFRVVDGSFAVFVGDVKVAVLVSGDWFGETSYLSFHFARARVVADKRGGTVLKISIAKLSAILNARPDLSSKVRNIFVVGGCELTFVFPSSTVCWP